MTLRRPLTLVNGTLRELPGGDTSATTSEVTLVNAGSGVTDLLTATDWFRHFTSGTLTEGGEVTDNGDGTISISACEVLIRSGATHDAPFAVFYVGASGPLTPADNDVTYYYLNYNGGSPLWGAGTSPSDYNGMDKMQAYTVARRGNLICVVDSRGQSIDGNRKTRRLLLEASGFNQNGFWHSRGGSTLTASGLNLSITAGKFYYGLAPSVHGAFDTSVAGTAVSNVFDYYYNRSSWTYTSNSKTLNNTQFDNAGTLTTLTNGRYRTDWVYIVLCMSVPRLVVIMGDAQYTSLATAQAAPQPAALPPWMDGAAVLLGQAVVLKSAVTATVQSAFVTGFTGASASDHNNLGGLQGGTAGEYYHLTSAEYIALAGKANSANPLFTGKITGDFSNATPSSRVSFQSTTANGSTVIQAVPNGTSTTSGYVVESSSSQAAGSPRGVFNTDGSFVTLWAGVTSGGTPTYVPLRFNVGGAVRVQIETTGDFNLKDVNLNTIATFSGAAPANSLALLSTGVLQSRGKDVLVKDLTWDDL